MIRYALFITTLSLGAASLSAQDFESVKSRYPDENGVKTALSEHIVFYFDTKGNLKASSSHIEESMVMKDNAINLFNTESVEHSYFNKLINLKAETLVPDKRGYRPVKSTGRKTVSATSDNIFYDDAERTSVTFTNLSAGVKTRMEYDMELADMHFLPRFYFKSYLPVLNASFSVTYPKEVVLGSVYLGNADTALIKKKSSEKNGMITDTWYATDVPRAKVFDNAPNIGYYLPHVAIYVKSYTNPVTKKTEILLKDVDALYQYLYSIVRENIDEDHPGVKALADSLTKGKSRPEEKAAAIYKWVQKNIRYVAYEDKMGGFVPRKPSLVCDKRFGDCKDMATLLRSLCKAAGLDAHIVWIGTRTLPYTLEEMPVPGVFNHMIAAVYIDNKWIFMDGTDPLIEFGTPPAAVLNKEGLVEMGPDRYRVVTIPVTGAGKSKLADVTTLKIADRSVSGHAAIRYTGYYATDIMGMLKYKTEKDKKDAVSAIVSRGSNKFSQSSYEYRANDTTHNEAGIISEFEVRDYVNKVGDEYYVNLNLDRIYNGASIDVRDRNVPVEIDYLIESEQTVELEIPEGYQASYVPGNASFKENGLVSYDFRYAVAGNKVKLIKNITFDTLLIMPEQFAAFNKFVAGLQSNYKESVVLSPK